MENRGSNIKIPHDIILNSRNKLSINGIKEIVNFDENTVSLKTVCGDLIIDGEDIHINVLNIEKGEIEMNGKITGLTYFDHVGNERHSLLAKIFR
jgi:sporulation protein YabP